MDNIEKILQSCDIEKIDVPQKVHYRVKNTLNNKKRNQKNILWQRFVTMILSIIGIFAGSVRSLCCMWRNNRREASIRMAWN